MYAPFNRFGIEMTLDQAQSASHAGDCEADVNELLQAPKIRRQLKKIQDADLIAELKEYGAWDVEELQDRAANEQRIIWTAACDIAEEYAERKRNK